MDLKNGSAYDVVQSLIDTNDLDTINYFFATFPQFMSAKTVWDVLTEKYPVKPERSFRILESWIEREFVRDFLTQGRGILGPLKELLEVIERTESKDKSNTLKLMMIRASRSNRRYEKTVKLRHNNSGILVPSSSQEGSPLGGSPKNGSPTNTIATRNMKSPYVISISGSSSPVGSPKMARGPFQEFTPLEPGKFDLEDLEPRDIAIQLTLIESEMLSRIKTSDFHNLKWKSGAGNPITRMVDRFNSVSYWVATEIVMQTEMKKRLSALRKFIAVAEVMREFQNFNGLMEIIGGLNLHPITRMKLTWEQVPASQRAMVEELNALMDNRQNYKDYRQLLKSVKGPAIPYLGVMTRDVIFTDEGNTNFVDAGKKTINVQKMAMLGEILMQLKRFQLAPYASTRFTDFKVHPVIREFLSKLVVLPEEMLYKHSLLCEPT
eukprot:TRINITY_DN19691_c0_g1_i1.p1 TRINITY_DN19691_c0_g1~~TRINITY_DN19691_c0_g1_i1.p1  ORF type:complete len:449 (-),score=103.72 TRINITY_DN19691_c0_g1_i1:103-1410(-)